MGLAFTKLHQVPRSGPILATVFALGLLIPIGTKLVLYYRAAPEGNQARVRAGALHKLVANGDVVVFTEGSGLPILYQLNRLGYRWEDRSCLNESARRRFSCRLYPRESEQPYFAPAAYAPNRPLNSEEVVREDVQDYLQPVDSAGGHFWVVFGEYSMSEGKHWFVDEDVRLIKELTNLGFKPRPNIGSYGVFLFRRS
jgi:hypothetical protein